ncbi:MAG: DUF1800 family protein [Proteobacteria bacterium]|nr:DUF1800 family protein [Pseudomonadota bacterium]
MARQPVSTAARHRDAATARGQSAVFPIRRPSAGLRYAGTLLVCAALFLYACHAFALNVGVWRPSTGRFLLDANGSGSIGISVPMGNGSTDRALAGDVNGDGISDLVIYRAGIWLVDENMDGLADVTFSFGGSPGDVPLLADLMGTGKAQPIIFRAGTWLVGDTSGHTVQTYHFGRAGDLPVIADFDGNGTPDLAVFRDGTWLINSSRDGSVQRTVSFGAKGDVPMAFDVDGDGRADFVVFRHGTWIAASGGTPAPAVLATVAFGMPGDQPVPVEPGLYRYRDAARFLAHATFGATRADIVSLGTSGPAAWLDRQFAMPRSSFNDYVYPRLMATVAQYPMAGGAQRILNSEAIWKQYFEGPDQLRQRVTYALSQILVISRENTTADWMACAASTYADVLAANAFGNYRDLLKAVTLNPAMADYLNLWGSAKADPVSGQMPNENYAREVLQLFSIGTVMLNQDGTPMLDRHGVAIPTYTQATVQSFARAFSGWTLAGQDFTQPWQWKWPVTYDRASPPDPTRNLVAACKAYGQPMQAWMTTYLSADGVTTLPGPPHDQAKKQLLAYPKAVSATLPANQTPMQDLDAAINNIFNHPNVGPFIGRQLIQRLVTSNPSPAYVSRVAAAFNNNGSGVRGDMRAVVRAILLDPEATDLASVQRPTWGRVREPVWRFVQAHRAFNARPQNAEGRYTVWDLSNSIYLNQDVLRAPSVFNFYSPTYSPTPALAQNGVVAPELEIETTDSVARYTDFSKWSILHGWGAYGANAPDSPWIKPDYSYYTALADQPVKLVAELDLVMAEGMLDPVFKDQLAATLATIPINSDGDRLERFYTAMWLIMNTPDGLVEK